MIKLSNVNKVFNKNKRNEVHVLKNASICLFNQGFVAITGASGSGKTTLLNVLCGLDKATSGEITIADTVVKKYKSRKWDFLRNKYFGYIFQNYNIFYEKTVFENVALALELLGIKDKKIIEERVIEALTIVKMEKYRNRYANSLSGGEQQRVAIARALVKDPKIIIADEPTGNLDEKNTLNIMNILKRISQDRLVILVTHEKDLATFYADRIVRISDGVILSDVVNDNKQQLIRYETHEIYLKELNEQTMVDDENISVIKYQDDKTSNKIEIKVILKNNNIYLTTNSPNSQIKILNEFSEIKVVNDYRPVITKETLDVESYQISPLDERHKGHYSIPFFVHLREGFKAIGKLSGFRKLMLLCFLFPAALLVVGISLWQGVSTVSENDFLNFDRHLVEIKRGESTVEEYTDDMLTILQQDNVRKYISSAYSGDISSEIYLSVYFSYNRRISTSFIPYDIVSNYPQNEIIPKRGEIVIDRYLVDELLNNNDIVSSPTYGGVVTESMLMNQKITLNVYKGGNFVEVVFKIVGIVDLKNGSCYINPADWHLTLESNVMFSDDLVNSTYDVKNLKDNEIIVPYEMKDYDKLTLEDRVYEIVGYHIPEVVYGMPIYGVSDNTKVYLSCRSTLRNTSSSYCLYVDDPATFKIEHDESISFDSVYALRRQEVVDANKVIYRVVIGIAAGLMIAPLVFLYFAQRANLFIRQKAIGIYRALGMNKAGIYKMSLGDIMAMTIVSSLPGYLFGLYITSMLYNSLAGSLFSMNLIVVLGSLLITIMTNVLVGIIPAMRLLAKTPREILISTDM